jgi:hypothetical protein
VATFRGAVSYLSDWANTHASERPALGLLTDASPGACDALLVTTTVKLGARCVRPAKAPPR